MAAIKGFAFKGNGSQRVSVRAVLDAAYEGDVPSNPETNVSSLVDNAKEKKIDKKGTNES